MNDVERGRVTEENVEVMPVAEFPKESAGMPWKVFVQGVFSEDDGSPSCSRICTGMAVSFSLGWVSVIVWYTHALPEFAGLSLFIGTLYGLNRLHSYLTAKKGNGDAA